MKALKPFVLLLLVCLPLAQLSSQTILRQSISCLGSSSQIHGGIISETVGQAYFTRAHFDSEIQLTPGFQQRLFAFIPETSSPDGMQVLLYPNPVSEELHLLPEDAIEDARIEIIDINGKVICQLEKDLSTEISIDLGHLAGGIYQIRIMDLQQKKVFNSRIIINK